MSTLIKLNFHFSVWLSIAGGILLFNNPDWFFDDPEDMFGPLKRNLLIVPLFLTVAQLVLWFARYTKNGRYEALYMSLIFGTVAGGLNFYAEVNGLPLLDWLPRTVLYIAISHGLYFVTKESEAEAEQDQAK